MIEEKDFDHAVARFKKRKDILPANRDAILRFLEHLKATDRGIHRRLKYLVGLAGLSKALGKPFEDCRRADFERVLLEKQKQGKSKNTLRDVKIISKKFMAWLEGCGKREYPPSVSWFEVGKSIPKKVEDEELLTDADVAELEASAPGYRDKAIIRVLADSGMRVGELLGLRIKDFKVQDGSRVLRVEGTKTKYSQRTVPLTNEATVKAIQDWISIHPKKKDSDALLFNGLKYATLLAMLERIVKRSGVKKPVNPHAFRHARATNYGNDPRLTRSQFCYVMGWSQSSTVPEVYMHDLEGGTLAAFARMRPSGADNKLSWELFQKMILQAFKNDEFAKKFHELTQNTKEFKEWRKLGGKPGEKPLHSTK